MVQHPQQGEQPCPAQEHGQDKEPSWSSARRAAVQGAGLGEGCPWRRELQGSLPEAPSLSPRACHMEAGSWSQGGFALDVPLLQRSTAPGSSVASSHPCIELTAGHGARIPEDGSDPCFCPRKVLAHEAETAGAVMAFFLSLGLALGAAVSFLFRILI